MIKQFDKRRPLDDLQPQDFQTLVTGNIWLQAALSAICLGIASALVERLLESKKGTREERCMVVELVENQASAIDGSIATALVSTPAAATWMFRNSG